MNLVGSSRWASRLLGSYTSKVARTRGATIPLFQSGGHAISPPFQEFHSSKLVLFHEGDAEVQRQILEALREQNKILSSMDKRNQKSLNNIDGTLGRIEKQGLGAGSRRGQKLRESKVVNGVWTFVEPDSERGWGQVTEGGKEIMGVDSWRVSSSKPSRTSLSGKPVWYSTDEERNSLSRLAFNESFNIPLKSGMYSLTVKYSTTEPPSDDPASEVGLIIGEIEFNNAGFVHAKGADWDKLLNGQKQMQLPYSHGARGEATWRKHKICEPWEGEMEIKLRIDTGTNTIIFQKADSPEVILRNVLAFTNNPLYPEFLQAFAYCDGSFDAQQDKPGVKLEIIEN